MHDSIIAHRIRMRREVSRKEIDEDYEDKDDEEDHDGDTGLSQTAVRR